jgi:hypothetical protein
MIETELEKSFMINNVYKSFHLCYNTRKKYKYCSVL